MLSFSVSDTSRVLFSTVRLNGRNRPRTPQPGNFGISQEIWGRVAGFGRLGSFNRNQIVLDLMVAVLKFRVFWLKRTPNLLVMFYVVGGGPFKAKWK